MRLEETKMKAIYTKYKREILVFLATIILGVVFTV